MILQDAIKWSKCHVECNVKSKVWCWEDLRPEIHAESQGIEDAYIAACKDEHGFSTFIGHLWFRRSILHEMAMGHAKQLGQNYSLVMHMRPFDTVLRRSSSMLRTQE